MGSHVNAKFELLVLVTERLMFRLGLGKLCFQLPVNPIVDGEVVLLWHSRLFNNFA